jgi:UDP-N-acetyl-D-mannosaminuronic acid dehydrogenase
MLLAVSRVNESVPSFLVDGVKRRLGGSLREKKVAVLGLAFKRDTDDERDSLSHKLVRLLERELADVAVHDPLVPTPTQDFEQAVSGADVVVVATNHSAYSTAAALASVLSLASGDAVVVDPWNAFGSAQVFAYAAELRALAGALD